MACSLEEHFGLEGPWNLGITQVERAHIDGLNHFLSVIDSSRFTQSRSCSLYASGNAMAPMSSRIRPGAGGLVGSSMTFSFIGAFDMAADSP